MKFQPVIKWSGSKRSLSNDIIQYFPKEIDTYYEPFCGGCSVNFDGKRNKTDSTYNIPKDLYSVHFYLDGKISGFKKLHSETDYVKESLYVKNS